MHYTRLLSASINMSISRNKKESLKIALTHEFYRCTDSYISFRYHLGNPSNKEDKRHKILCFNAYSDFLSHLYEFYVISIKRSKVFQESSRDKSFFSVFRRKENKTNKILTEEIKKLFKNRKNRILNGYKDDLNLPIDFYDQVIPANFGLNLSKIRNWRNHVDSRRASGKQISLSEFYQKYGNLVAILFHETRWLWQINENNFDWQEIDSFYDKIKDAEKFQH